MNTDGRLLRSVFDELQDDASGAAAQNGWEVDARNAARSRKNISQWRSYLPEDCVDTMIRMGWDVTT
jgi:hypothetical protein